MESAKKSYGPFDITREGTGYGKQVLAIPFNQVKGGATVLVVASDNMQIRSTSGFPTSGGHWAAAEVAIFGKVGGVKDCLIRQWVRQGSGPCKLWVAGDEPWDQLLIYGRNVSGGAPIDQVLGAWPLVLQLNVFVGAHQGIADAPAESKVI